jgi:hypothetical protein
MMKNERCDNDKNTSVFAALRRDKWILDIPCSILDIQILKIFSMLTHLKLKRADIYG